MQEYGSASVDVYTLPGPRSTASKSVTVLDMLEPFLNQPAPRIVVDCSEVDYLDSRISSLLMIALRRAATSGGEIKLAGVRPSVMTLLETMHLHKMFDIHPTVESAIASFEA